MVDDVRRLAVFAHDDVGRIAERPAVQTIQRRFRAADDGVGRVVVFRPQGFLQVDGIDPRVSATRCQYEGIGGERGLCQKQQQAAGNHAILELHIEILPGIGVPDLHLKRDRRERQQITFSSTEQSQVRCAPPGQADRLR